MAPQEQRVWVEIGMVILQPEQRTANLPEDTKSVPYSARIKGFAPAGTSIGDTRDIQTLSGRTVRGEVVAVAPPYPHTYGEPVPELIEAGLEVRRLMQRIGERDVAQ